MRCHTCDGRTDEHTDGQWKVEPYSVWTESAICSLNGYNSGRRWYRRSNNDTKLCVWDEKTLLKNFLSCYSKFQIVFWVDATITVKSIEQKWYMLERIGWRKRWHDERGNRRGDHPQIAMIRWVTFCCTLITRLVTSFSGRISYMKYKMGWISKSTLRLRGLV